MQHGWTIDVRQQPQAARASSTDRRPIDPVVILQLRHKRRLDVFLDRETSSFFCFAQLQEIAFRRDASDQASQPAGASADLEEVTKADRAMTGTVLSSLFLLKDPSISASDRGAFFVFPDLSVRSEGIYRLHFTVFGIREGRAFFLTSCRSSNFQVYSAKRFPGMSDSTDLSRAFAEQGLKIRIRKETRPGRKRGRDPSVDSGGLAQSVGEDGEEGPDEWQTTSAPQWATLDMLQPQQPIAPLPHRPRFDEPFAAGPPSPLYTHPYATSGASTPATPGFNFNRSMMYAQPTSSLSRITLPPIGRVFDSRSIDPNQPPHHQHHQYQPSPHLQQQQTSQQPLYASMDHYGYAYMQPPAQAYGGPFLPSQTEEQAWQRQPSLPPPE